jgi:hypothetical protein
MVVYFYAFITSAIGGGGWSDSLLSWGRAPETLWTGWDVLQIGLNGAERKPLNTNL